MGFEKVRMGKDLIFDTIVTDVDGRELAKWKCMRGDFPKVCRILNSKFGLNMAVIDKKEKQDKDLDWAT